MAESDRTELNLKEVESILVRRGVAVSRLQENFDQARSGIYEASRALYTMFKHLQRSGVTKKMTPEERDSYEAFIVSVMGIIVEGKAEVSYQNNTNSKTGLFDENYFGRYLEDECAAMKRGLFQEDIAVIAIDLAGLKSFNDKLAMSAGDDAIQRTADIIEEIKRDGEITARYGGDEFVLLVRNSQNSPDFPNDALARINQQLREKGFVFLESEDGSFEPGFRQLHFYTSVARVDDLNNPSAAVKAATDGLNDAKAEVKKDRASFDVEPIDEKDVPPALRSKLKAQAQAKKDRSNGKDIGDKPPENKF